MDPVSFDTLSTADGSSLSPTVDRLAASWLRAQPHVPPTPQGRIPWFRLARRLGRAAPDISADGVGAPHALLVRPEAKRHMTDRAEATRDAGSAMQETIVYDARTDGSLFQVWWLSAFMIFLCLLACYATWCAAHYPDSYWGRRQAGLREAGKGGLWDKRHPFAYAVSALCFFSSSTLLSLINLQVINYRFNYNIYQTWKGILTSDTIEYSDSRRRPTIERDTLWISGMRFTISCWVRSGRPLRYGSAGSCNGLVPGKMLTAVYLPLPHSRYRLAAVQIRLMQ